MNKTGVREKSQYMQCLRTAVLYGVGGLKQCRIIRYYISVQ